MNLKGKKIILAVTGSIAAYKTPNLVRMLVKSGAEVRVITTAAAEKFVSPLSLSTVAKSPVLSNVSDGDTWNNHVALGRWADILLIAPCSANTLAKLANGLCDNLVCAVYLSAICPVMIAPAMDEDMWHHPATRKNLASVIANGNHIIPVAHGELASGLIGDGRMAEETTILSYLADFFTGATGILSGKKVLVTAGPTYERLDPVRFIGNFSTGKMGVALAEECAALGAEVTLVLGPSRLHPDHPRIRVIAVEAASEMYKACLDAFTTADIALMAAAVADYRPKEMAPEKIKKAATAFELELVKNPDILSALGAVKTAAQLLVGFALETNNELDNAQKKLAAKNADFIVLNSLRDPGAGFGGDTNKVSILSKDGTVKELPLQHKQEVAAAIINHILSGYE